MQRNGGGIAILADDHYEDPELWRILWLALLAGDDGEATGSAGSVPPVRAINPDSCGDTAAIREPMSRGERPVEPVTNRPRT
jgi:hypothetical protein